MGTLVMKPEPDGLGYFYGEFIADDGTRLRVDVLPPRSYPQPWFVAETSPAAHETDWIVHVNGEEVARVKDRDRIEEALAALPSPDAG